MRYKITITEETVAFVEADSEQEAVEKFEEGEAEERFIGIRGMKVEEDGTRLEDIIGKQ